MEELNGSTLFWLLSLGLLTGYVTKLFLGNRGAGLIANTLAGGAGTIIVGVLAMKLEIPGSLAIGFMGCLALLFVMNVFSSHPSELSGPQDTGMH